MSDILIRMDGCAGRATLNRPAALNALTAAMVDALAAALERWRDDDRVTLVLIDAAGDRAFCAGGDIAELYARGRAGDFAFGQDFWRREYRLNLALARYPKPVVTLMQGFTMGGGVGLGCHATHRVVGETSQIAMPECGIGLVPDVGGSFLLAQAPGHLGTWFGTTGTRMDAPLAIDAGFADWNVPEARWPALADDLCATGDTAVIEPLAISQPEPAICPIKAAIEAHFGQQTLAAIEGSLAAEDSDFARDARARLARVSPLSAACTVEMQRRLRDGGGDLQSALAQEYRFTYRAQQHADFLEGIRAAVIDKDRAPRWRHPGPAAVTQAEVEAMLAPLGPLELWEDRP
jgi:enoyl-CoA hydratase